MNEHSYQYLFPYEKVPVHSKILIYGAGTLGQDYLYQMQLTHYCEVVAIADKNYSEYPPMVVPVISPERIHEFSFDYVVIALRMAAALSEVKRILNEEAVAEKNIVCIFERERIRVPIFKEQTAGKNLIVEDFAFSKTPLSIAILSTGGFGDMVIQKRFVMELIRLAPGCLIDFYNIKSIDLLKHLYTDCRNVNQVKADLGSRYQGNYKHYALALTIEACHYIKVDFWEKKCFTTEEGNPYREFVERIDRLKKETDQENVDLTTPAHLTMIRRAYQGLNAYSGFNYNGAFHIWDKKVSVPIDNEWEAEFSKLDLGRYITVNLGNGDCADGSKIAKSWSKDRFERLIHLWKKRFPAIGVVQLGSENAEKIGNADHRILGADFRLIIHVLKNSILHIDIEGGLVHLATQLGTKCVVLFGPTVKEYYGYEQNINIQAGNCHNCWGLYSDVNRCARGMKEPECMYSITPELVMKYIDKYMGVIYLEASKKWKFS